MREKVSRRHRNVRGPLVTAVMRERLGLLAARAQCRHVRVELLCGVPVVGCAMYQENTRER